MAAQYRGQAGRTIAGDVKSNEREGGKSYEDDRHEGNFRSSHHGLLPASMRTSAGWLRSGQHSGTDSISVQESSGLSGCWHVWSYSNGQSQQFRTMTSLVLQSLTSPTES